MSSKRRINRITASVTAFILMLVVVLLFVAGCGIPPWADFHIEPPAPTKIPLRVGLYLSPAFRSYYHTYQGIPTYPMGGAMSNISERALKAVFQEVVVLDEKAFDLAKNDVRAVISPEMVATENTWSVFRITCKWTIASTDGKILYVNTFTGDGNDNSFVGNTRIGKAMANATKDMFQKFLSHMTSVKWWEDIGDKPMN